MTIAVLTQARPELIERTYEAIEGTRRAIVHLYNSTSTTQRRVVFGMDRAGVRELAVRATVLCRELAEPTDGRSSSSTRRRASTTRSSISRSRSAKRWPSEWAPTPDEKMIVNLPTTVEHFPPNVYADRIEWFARNFSQREADHAVRPPAQRPRQRQSRPPSSG